MLAGQVLAGVLSGDPTIRGGLNLFSSTVVTPRVMFLQGEGDSECNEGSSGSKQTAVAGCASAATLAAVVTTLLGYGYGYTTVVGRGAE